MREGKVVRIIGDRQIVIDLGANDGVKEGMRFAIVTQKNMIEDPATGRTLGELEMRKATVVAEVVYPQFTVAGPTRVSTLPYGVLGSEPGSLNVSRKDLKPLLGGGPVSVGDRVLASVETA